MKQTISNMVKYGLLLIYMWIPQHATAAVVGTGNIDAANKYAWSENTGWQNYRPTHGGVTVHATYLSGFVWAENIGFIELGNSGATVPYLNTTSTNWGVKRASNGNLSGYAWSENAGWINFKTTHSQVSISTVDGSFSGFAWGENVGWIHFMNASPGYNVVTTFIPDITAPTGTISINAGSIATNTTAVTLTLTCNDNIACTQMQFSNDNVTYGGLTANATSAAWTLAAGADGIRTVYARFKDAAGNVSAAVSDTITLDTTAPTLTSVGIASNNATTTLAKAGDVVTVTFTASEILGALPTATIAAKVATVTNTGGLNYTATYAMIAGDAQGAVAFAINFTDAAGNAGAQVVTVNNGSAVVFDSIAPTITRPANITVEATAISGAAKTNTAIATFLNGAVTAGATTAVATNNAPATFPLGITTVTFTAMDAAGNAAAAVIATVTVVDTSPPAILNTPLADVAAEATGVKTAVALTAPASTDIFTVTVTNNAPATGFSVGTTVVVWTATDANGNASIANQNVIVSDTTAPVITLTGSNPVTMTAGVPYADAGATATDLVDGNMTVTVVNPVPNPATEGVFAITYNVTDAAGNAATQVTRIVRVAAVTTTNNGSVDLLTLTGTSGTVNIVSTGEALFGLTATATTGSAPANVSFPFGVIDYSTSVTSAGASKTVRLTFSAPLPASPVVYKVDGAGVYTLLPTSVWTKIDANTIDITLTDGDPQTDLDGAINGLIHDPLAVGSNVAPAPVVASSGGCVINPTASFDPVLWGMLLLSGLYGMRRRRN